MPVVAAARRPARCAPSRGRQARRGTAPPSAARPRGGGRASGRGASPNMVPPTRHAPAWGRLHLPGGTRHAGAATTRPRAPAAPEYPGLAAVVSDAMASSRSSGTVSGTGVICRTCRPAASTVGHRPTTGGACARPCWRRQVRSRGAPEGHRHAGVVALVDEEDDEPPLLQRRVGPHHGALGPQQLGPARSRWRRMKRAAVGLLGVFTKTVTGDAPSLRGTGPRPPHGP